MIDILLVLIIIVLGSILLRAINIYRVIHKQHTFVYCPKCHNELVKNGLFIEDNDGIIKYCCSKCGGVSFWDFGNYPVPMLRTCGDCKYLIDDGFGSTYCEKENLGECSSDTQVMFDYGLHN